MNQKEASVCPYFMSSQKDDQITFRKVISTTFYFLFIDYLMSFVLLFIFDPYSISTLSCGQAGARTVRTPITKCITRVPRSLNRRAIQRFYRFLLEFNVPKRKLRVHTRSYRYNPRRRYKPTQTEDSNMYILANMFILT